MENIIKITFIYCFRDRDRDRVKHSLDSLACQTDKSFKVIFLDYGSESSDSNDIEQLVTKYPFVKYIYNDSRKMAWNRSHALNSAIKIADTEYIFTSDIDMIYKPGFVSELNSIIEPGKAFFFAAIYLPEGELPGNPQKEKKYPVSNDEALGWGLLPIKTLKEIRGYDEFYCIWGKEDNDIGNRLKSAGIKVQYISEIWMFHYYHKPVSKQFKIFPYQWLPFLDNYYEYSKNELERNKNYDWGRLLNENDRLALNQLNNHPEKLKQINGRCRFFRYVVESELDKSSSGRILSYYVVDNISGEYHNARLTKISKHINSLLEKLNIPFIVNTPFQKWFEDIYSYKDELMFLLITRKNVIEDYAYEHEGDSLKIVIIKK